MKDNIHLFPGICKSPDAILEAARKEGLDSVVIMGWVGDDFILASSNEYSKDTLWDIEVAKRILLE